MRKLALACVCALLLLGVLSYPAQAQPPKPRLEDAPGYLPMSELGFARQELSVEINLEGALLRMVGETAREDDPELAKLVGEIKAIRVQIAPLKEMGAEKAHARIGQAARWLDDKGWKAAVRVREKDEETYIFTREVGGEIVGLAVLSVEPDEAALINIVGHLDPAQLGSLGHGLHLRALEKVPGKNASHKD
ncbi:MAG TPA: DUF4252 domain-containing protein [Thermoanaerobaculia bacterium]|nr:DUF4252 domain-containing protein [Thermoanaerobaculia bacterium]